MKKFLTLAMFLTVLFSLTGCMLKSPSYDGAKKISMLDEDKEAYLNSGIMDYQLTLFNHSEEFMWTKDELLDAQKNLDKTLPADKWRLVTEWQGDQNSKRSEWKNAEIGLIVVMFGNLDGTQISNLERRYGMTGIEPGATLVLMYTYDKNKPQPDRTATVQAKNAQMTATAVVETPTPKK
jgi:hypothetical protein